MPLSLEQFDERVSRANKSMDRREAMLDSTAERQATHERQCGNDRDGSER